MTQRELRELQGTARDHGNGHPATRPAKGAGSYGRQVNVRATDPRPRTDATAAEYRRVER